MVGAVVQPSPVELRAVKGKQFVNNPPKKGRLPDAFFCSYSVQEDLYSTGRLPKIVADTSKVGFLSAAPKEGKLSVRDTERIRDQVRKEITTQRKNLPKDLPPLDNAPLPRPSQFIPPTLPHSIAYEPPPLNCSRAAQWEDEVRRFKQQDAAGSKSALTPTKRGIGYNDFYRTSSQTYGAIGGEILEMEQKNRLKRLENPPKRNEGSYFRVAPLEE